MLSGPSSSGKTTTARFLSARLREQGWTRMWFPGRFLPGAAAGLPGWRTGATITGAGGPGSGSAADLPGELIDQGRTRIPASISSPVGLRRSRRNWLWRQIPWLFLRASTLSILCSKSICLRSGWRKFMSILLPLYTTAIHKLLAGAASAWYGEFCGTSVSVTVPRPIPC